MIFNSLVIFEYTVRRQVKIIVDSRRKAFAITRAVSVVEARGP